MSGIVVFHKYFNNNGPKNKNNKDKTTAAITSRVVDAELNIYIYQIQKKLFQ